MTTIKYLRAMIELGELNLEVFQLPDCSYVLSRSQVLKAVDATCKDLPRKISSKRLKRIPCMALNLPPIIVNGGVTHPLSISQAVVLWHDFALDGNQDAIKLLQNIAASNHPLFVDYKNIVIPKQKVSHLTKSESYYSGILSSRLNGVREVETESGRIDILTSSQIIEVKIAKNWKAAIGQVLVYGSYYPSHQKRIHLLGSSHSTFNCLVTKHCDRLNILVTWQEVA